MHIDKNPRLTIGFTVPVWTIDSLPPERLEIMRHRSSREILRDDVLKFVERVFEDVKKAGDGAVAEATQRFDRVNFRPDQLVVSEKEILAARSALKASEVTAIVLAIENSRKYNMLFKPSPMTIHEVGPGIQVGRKTSPIESVALYVPCGKGSYPSTFITIAVPAIVAGVKDIQVILPPKPDGSVDSAVLTAGSILGITKFYRANGVAAIAAAAIGTERINKVQKIVGPGGDYIMAAQLHARQKGIDVGMFYGPSECMVIADDSADPELVAADMINEAEHGNESSAILITTSAKLASSVSKHIVEQLPGIPEWRRKFAETAITRYGGIIIVKDLDQAVDLANDLANEHIQIVTHDAMKVAERIHCASEILVGQNTTFSAISYAIGVPACLPTGQFAKTYSPVTVDTFMRSSAITSLDAKGLESLAPIILPLAEYEGFPAHVASITIRERKGIIKV